MKIKLEKNYIKGNRAILAGTVMDVMPWFYWELKNGGYLDKEKKKGKAPEVNTR